MRTRGLYTKGGAVPAARRAGESRRALHAELERLRDEVAARRKGPQSRWLERIAKQVKLEAVVDSASLDEGQFKADGVFARLNKVFDGKLEGLLGELADEVWKGAG